MTAYTEQEFLKRLRAGKPFRDDDTVLSWGPGWGSATSVKFYLELRGGHEQAKVQFSPPPKRKRIRA